MTHRIRLRGPWEVDLATTSLRLDGSKVCEISSRVSLPASWKDLFGATTGIVRVSRKFHQPTGLEDSHVFLEIPPTNLPGTVWLNEDKLGSFDGESATMFDIHERLKAFNRVGIELVCEDISLVDGGLTEPICLTICPSDSGVV